MTDDDLIVDQSATSVGSYLFQPIATLLEQMILVRRSTKKLSNIPTTDCMYGAALITLVPILTESYIDSAYALTRWARPTDLPSPWLDLLDKQFPNTSAIQNLFEVYAVRHAIVHNHIWRRDMTITITKTPSINMTVQTGEFERDPAYSKRPSFLKYVNLETRRTQQLGINVVPTEHTYRDVLIVLQAMVRFLRWLESEVEAHNHTNLSISHQIVQCIGPSPYFVEIIDHLVLEGMQDNHD